jgi:polyisoprenoid-binding protein YceI
MPRPPFPPIFEEDSPMNRFTSSLAATAIVAAAFVAPSVAVAADTWQIDPAHSAAQFSVTHLMISTVRGEFGAMSGTIEYDGKDVSSIKVNVTIDATSITTRNEYRDKDLKSDHFFDVAKFPTVVFKSTKVVPGKGGAFQLVGDLTMHGVTKEVTLDVTAPSKVIKGMRGESRVGAAASTKISRQEFGINWNAPVEGGGVVVSDAVAITIDLEAMFTPTLAAPPAPPAKK